MMTYFIFRLLLCDLRILLIYFYLDYQRMEPAGIIAHLYKRQDAHGSLHLLTCIRLRGPVLPVCNFGL